MSPFFSRISLLVASLSPLVASFAAYFSYVPKLQLPRLPRGDEGLVEAVLSRLREGLSNAIDAYYFFFENSLRNARLFFKKQKRADWQGRIDAFAQFLQGWVNHPRLPRRLGTALTFVFFAVTLVFSLHRGQHWGEVQQAYEDTRNDAAYAIGFGIQPPLLSGLTLLTPEDIHTLIGLKSNSALPFFDIEQARLALLKNPWIAQASLKKLFPNQLQIEIAERKPAALWQRDRRLAVIAADGTVLLESFSPEFKHLPLLVGRGGDKETQAFLEAVEAFPLIKENMRAGIFVAERQWRILMKNGTEIKLPEQGMSDALRRLVALEREKRFLSLDILTIDLRLHDRVTVRLSTAAIEAKAAAQVVTTKPKDKSL
jgi:cell division protein FtsQ